MTANFISNLMWAVFAFVVQVANSFRPASLIAFW